MLKMVHRGAGVVPSCTLALLALALLAPMRAAAQATAPAEDDLEIPAAPPPAAAPGAASAPAPAPGRAAAAPAPPPVPAPEPASATTPPASAAAAPAAPEAAVASDATAEPAAHEDSPAAAPRPAIPTGNLELTAHSRPVPHGLLLSGFLQAELVSSQLSEDQLEQSGAPFNRDEFALRAARLRIDGGHQFSAYAFELDATTRGGASVGIRRAEGQLLWRASGDEPGAASVRPPLLALTAGVTDLPFGFELVESTRTRAFMERSAGSEALFPTPMDVGIKLHGAWAFLRYALALVNGEPVDRAIPRDSNAHKDLVGRFGADAAFGDGVGLSGGTSFAFGRGFHRGSVAVKDSVAWRDDNNDGVAVPSELIGVPGSAATPSENFKRWAIGLDFQLHVRSPIGFTRFAAEGFVAQNHDRGGIVSDPIQTGFDVRQVGGYLGLTQELSPYALVGFRVDVYDPNSDFFEERRGELRPRSQEQLTLSPIVGLTLPQRARLIVQYDVVRDELGRDAVGNPSDAENNRWTARLQVDL